MINDIYMVVSSARKLSHKLYRTFACRLIWFKFVGGIGSEVYTNWQWQKTYFHRILVLVWTSCLIIMTNLRTYSRKCFKKWNLRYGIIYNSSSYRIWHKKTRRVFCKKHELLTLPEHSSLSRFLLFY